MAINLPEGYGYIEPIDNGNEDSIKSYVSEMKKSNNIIEFDLTYRSSSVYWTRTIHQLDFPSIYETVLETGSMTILPIEIMRGIQHHTILSPTSKAFLYLIKTLKNRFSDVRIKTISSSPKDVERRLLTQKQFEAFQLAYDRGYYDIPRRIRIKDLARDLNIKRVAMQERLRRAELKIFRYFRSFHEK